MLLLRTVIRVDCHVSVTELDRRSIVSVGHQSASPITLTFIITLLRYY